MNRKNKKEVKMVDMTARLDVEVVPATEKEIEEANREFEKIYMIIEEKTRRYEEEVSENILKFLSQEIKVEKTDKDAKYFLKNYDYLLNLTNCTHIENKILKYQECFSNSERTCEKK